MDKKLKVIDAYKDLLQKNSDKSSLKDYLKDLGDDDLDFLLTAFDLGRSLVGDRNGLENDISYFDGLDNLVSKSLKTHAIYFDDKDAVDYLLGKENDYVYKSIDAFEALVKKD